MILRGRSQGQKDGAERENGKGREARGRASGSPPISPNDLGQPWRGAGPGPNAAQTPGPDMSEGTRGPCLAGSGVVPRVRSAGSGRRTLCWVGREAGGAVRGAENSPCPRGAIWSGAPRCAVPGLQRRQDKSRQGRAGAPRALSPETPRSLTLPGAEQKCQDSGGAHDEAGAPSRWRSGAGHSGHPGVGWLNRRGGAGYRGVGAGMGGVSVCVCLSVRPPALLH